jgi:thioesterase domain-containing protein
MAKGDDLFEAFMGRKRGEQVNMFGLVTPESKARAATARSQERMEQTMRLQTRLLAGKAHTTEPLNEHGLTRAEQAALTAEGRRQKQASRATARSARLQKKAAKKAAKEAK